MSPEGTAKSVAWVTATLLYQRQGQQMFRYEDQSQAERYFFF